MPSSGSSHIVKGILLSIVACSEYIIIETICRRCVAVDGNGQATFPKELFLTSGTEFGVNIRLSSLESSYIALIYLNFVINAKHFPNKTKLDYTSIFRCVLLDWICFNQAVSTTPLSPAS
ncbi:11252_t:CDS:2 [Entrophospora sp. SA101]|nr:2563_t:CDS:2 [Entrophospora sp. SA101]CAJ0856649.1 11252_t:CDS:2 [Entrophospora sp. SA101]